MVSILVLGRRSLIIGALTIFASVGQSQVGWCQEPGEQAFKTTCIACHTIGGGRLVGPDLAGVHDKRSQGWLENFVKSPQSMIDDGDAEAIALFEEFNRIPMPDSFLTEEEIRQVLGYVRSQSTNQATATSPGAVVQEAPAEPASEAEIFAGQELFQGKVRLANGGAACNSCHEVRNDAVIGGGILATELTTVFSRMGGAGVKAILGRAPFPIMQAAYQGQPLIDKEITALVAFLEYADSEQYNQLPRDYGLGLFLSGLVGATALFLLFAFVWRSRKRGAVNQAIFDRQTKSVSDNRH